MTKYHAAVSRHARRGCLIALALAIGLVVPSTSAARARSLDGSAASWLGSLAGADSLANTRIGGPYGTALAYGFRADWSGRISSIRFYVVVNSATRLGYSDGTGGTLRISIVGDRSGTRHIPGAGSFANVNFTPPTSDAWPLVRFPHPARIHAGRRYYVVFTNIDPDPLHNYASVNALLSNAAGAAPPPLPDGMRVLLADTTDGGATPIHWRSRSQHPNDVYLPLIEVRGDRKGEVLGLGYMESWVSNPKPIGGAFAIRERFTFERSTPAHVTDVRVRLRRLGPEVTPLRVVLESADGRALAEADVPADGIDEAAPGWVSAHFAKPPVIRPGMRLALVLRSDAPDSYEGFPLRDGAEFGFGPPTVFGPGYAEFTSGGSWTGWDQWGASDRRDGDLQFGLRLVP